MKSIQKMEKPSKKKQRTNPKSSKSKGFRLLAEDEPRKVRRGEDMYGYGEQKERIGIAITKTAKEILARAAEKAELPRSEFLERLLRSDFLEEWLRNENKVAQTLNTRDRNQGQ